MKKLIYTIFIIAIIAGGCFAGYKLIENTENNNQTKEVNSNTVENTDADLENNVIDNETRLNELEDEEDNNTNSNTTSNTNNTVNNNTTNDNGTKNTTNSNSVKSEAQAIEVVKQNWGKDNTVYFTSDGKDKKGNYIIVVREKSSTKALYFYSVDEDGTFTIQ